MNKRILLAIVAIFITWSILDFVIHGVLLQSAYEATASLWRPMVEIKIGLSYLVTMIFTVCFVLIYALQISDKSMATGIKYGFLFGLAMGVSMGFGSYSYMPIPYTLAFTWFAGTLVESILAGAIVGAIVKQ